MSSTDKPTTWTFLTNHAQVLFCLAEIPDIRLRDVAERVVGEQHITAVRKFFEDDGRSVVEIGTGTVAFGAA